MQRTLKKPEVRKMELIQVAEMLFEKMGYSNTSVEAIIKEAKIAKGTFYYYFESKTELLKAIVDKTTQQLLEYFQSVMDKEDMSAIDKLKMMLRGSDKPTKSKPEIMEIVHNPKNRELHEQINIQSILVIAPVIAKVIEQGNREGVFNVERPKETIQLLIAGSQFVLDSGLFSFTMEKKTVLLSTFQSIFEKAIGAQPGILSFVMDMDKDWHYHKK